MGWFSSKGKEGTFIEGRQSKEHTHRDGSKGRDTYAAKATYKGGEKVSESRASGWGKSHSDSPSKDSSGKDSSGKDSSGKEGK